LKMQKETHRVQVGRHAPAKRIGVKKTEWAGGTNPRGGCSSVQFIGSSKERGGKSEDEGRNLQDTRKYGGWGSYHKGWWGGTCRFTTHHGRGNAGVGEGEVPCFWRGNKPAGRGKLDP